MYVWKDYSGYSVENGQRVGAGDGEWSLEDQLEATEVSLEREDGELD